MKYQQISVDFISMVFTACSYLVLAGAVWIFLRLIQACFWLPRHLKRQNHVQRMLQDKVLKFSILFQQTKHWYMLNLSTNPLTNNFGTILHQALDEQSHLSNKFTQIVKFFSMQIAKSIVSLFCVSHRMIDECVKLWTLIERSINRILNWNY